MPRRETVSLPVIAPGNQRSLTAFHYGKPGARPKAYIQASLHADELPGMMCAAHLRPLLDAAEAEGRIQGEIILVPVANPIGLAQTLNGHHMGRFAFEEPGTNFNREWPHLAVGAAEHLGDASPTPDAVRQALKASVEDLPDLTENNAMRKQLLRWSIDSDYVLDMHCDQEALAHIYGLTEQSDDVSDLSAWIDAPILLMEELASGLAFDACNSAPWQELRDILGNADIPAACFAVTVEFRGQSDVTDAFGAADARGVFGFLTARGLISGDGGERQASPGKMAPLEATDVLKSPCGGLLAWKTALGATVAVGEVVCEVIDPLADDPTKARTPIISQAAGVLFSREMERLAHPGRSVGKVFGQEPLAHRTVGALLEN